MTGALTALIPLNKGAIMIALSRASVRLRTNGYLEHVYINEYTQDECTTRGHPGKPFQVGFREQDMYFETIEEAEKRYQYIQDRLRSI